MKIVIKILMLLMMLFPASLLFAQQGGEPEMADVMRSNGKIYIVVAVCLTILIGLFLYVWNVDRKVSKLEKETR